MGKRKFSHFFLNPINDVDKLNIQYDILDYLKEIKKEDFHNAILNNLMKMKDLEKMNRQILLQKITPEIFFMIYENGFCVLNIIEQIEKDRKLINYLSDISDLEKLKIYVKEMQTFIQSHFQLELLSSCDKLNSFDTNFILPGVDELLDKEMNIIEDSYEKLMACKNYFQSLLIGYEKPKKETEMIKIHETEKNNFSLVITNRRAKILKDLCKNKKITLNIEKKEFVLDLEKYPIDFHKQTTTNQFIYHPQINNLCKDIHHLKGKIREHIQRIFIQFVKKFEIYYKPLDTISHFITQVDLLWCHLHNIQKFHLSKPEIIPSKKSFFDISGIRHLLIEHFQTEEIYVSNDIELGTEKQQGILLYGTNAVGKTSLIKSIGISILMAQSGMFVPCMSMKYCPYQSIFTRIIGNDNLFKGLSTFAVEMSELRTILRMSNANSLILGDELCSGTESVSAISIFLAGIKQLYDKQSSFIFATHYHEIIDKEEITSLQNLHLKHMEVFYDKEKQKLMYDRKIKDGPGNNMYGLEVCKSLLLPEDFLELANSIRLKYHPESNSILLKKTSDYNNQKIKGGKCEICQIHLSEEVHHLEYQRDSDKNGFIQKDNTIFHKNHPANLVNICKKCHDDIHKKNKKMKKVKGNIIVAKDLSPSSCSP